MRFKLKRGQTLTSQTRKIIHNVAEFCSEEAALKRLKIPLNCAIKRAAEATGVSVSTIKRLRKEVDRLKEGESLKTPGKHRKRQKSRNCSVEELDKCAIRHTVLDIYSEELKMPSLTKLLPILKKKINFRWKIGSLQRVMKSMNFRWKYCTRNKKVLVEKPDVVFWRNKYLRDIKKFRQSGRDIVYISEISINSNLTFQKCFKDNLAPGHEMGKINTIVNIIAGSAKGFVPGSLLIYNENSKSSNYSGKLNYNNFEKWLLRCLIPNLPSNSVVCLDNAPYHSKIINQIPTMYSKKNEMIDWLNNMGISNDSNMRKDQLFSLIKKQNSQEVICQVDKILKDNGHDVLRIPPSHCDLNLMEYVWLNVKKFLLGNHTNECYTSMDYIEEFINTTIAKMEFEEFQVNSNKIKKLEDIYWERDEILEDLRDEYVIVDSDSNSSIGDSFDSMTDISETEIGNDESDSEDLKYNYKIY